MIWVLKNKKLCHRDRKTDIFVAIRRQPQRLAGCTTDFKTYLYPDLMNPIAPLRILLADDDHDDTFLFQEALNQIPIGTTLSVAENGVELLQILKDTNNKPDIIFLDMNMPVKNGLECLEEIRGTEGYEHVPIVILSTSVAQYLWESAYRNGANLYIQKPNSFNGLIEIIKKCLLESTSAVLPEGLNKFLITN